MRTLRMDAVGIVLAMVLVGSATAWGGVVYTGTLQAPVLVGSPGLKGTGNWVAPSPGTPITSFTWTVSRDSDSDPWLYCYDFSTTAQGGLSHIVIEVSQPTEDSPGFTLDDIVPGSASASYVLGWATSANGNPNIPGPLYGLKFAGNAQTVDQICFKSYKTPVWGDFYAKNGAAGGEGVNTAWNAGFLDPDPLALYTADPADMNFHILRPDTDAGGGDPVPEPAAALLFALPCLAIGLRRKRGMKMAAMLALIGIATVIAGPMAVAGTYQFVPTRSNGVVDHDLEDLNHDYAYEWGIETAIPENEEIVAASIFYDRIRNWNNNPNDLYVTLLNSNFKGINRYWDNEGGGDYFLNQGLRLEHYEDYFTTSAQTFTYHFDEAEVDQLITNLTDDDFVGLGFDPDCHFYNCGIKLTIETDTQGGDDPIPEPAAALLFALPCLAIGLRRKRGMKMAAMIAVIGLVSVMAGTTAVAGTYQFVPSDPDLGDLDHRYAYEWGIRIEIPETEEIVAANIFFRQIRNWDDNDNDLYVTLLDSNFEGIDISWDNQGGGDYFAGQGLLLNHYEDLSSTAQNITYNFDQAEIDQLTTNLGDDLAGIGFDPDCHFYNRCIKLTIETDTQGGDDPIPEPASLGLVGIALLAVRKRRS